MADRDQYWVPVIDASGSTLGLVNAASPQSGMATTYTYDPSGTATASGAANEWPFQYKGMEKEFTDPAPYYYSGSGQFYSPQMVGSLAEAGETSSRQGACPSGAIGAPSDSSGLGLNFPSSVGAVPENSSEGQTGRTTITVTGAAGAGATIGAIIGAAVGTPLAGAVIGGAVGAIVGGIASIFGGGGAPPTPRQLLHGRHPLYPDILGFTYGEIPDQVSAGKPQFSGDTQWDGILPLQSDNGNLWGTFTKQDGVCTVPIFGNLMNRNPCMLGCCIIHDNCYTAHQCNYSSWLNPCLAPVGSGCLKSCDECNGE